MEINSSLNSELLEQQIQKDIVNEGTGDYYRINKLYLSNLSIVQLPPSIENLDSLTVLRLNDNNLETLPFEICNVAGNIINLDTLKLDHNKLCTPNIPSCNGNLIIDYGLQDCTFDYHEEDVQFLSELVLINQENESQVWYELEYDSLYQIVNESAKWGYFAQNDTSLIRRIIKLDLHSLDISELPETSIGFLDELTELELENNNLTRLPDPITTLTKLEILQVYNNQLVSIPYFIGNLAKLEELYINNNQITDLRESMGDLLNLKVLYAQSNNLGFGPGLPLNMCTYVVPNLDDLLLGCNNLPPDYVDTCFESFLGEQDCGE